MICVDLAVVSAPNQWQPGEVSTVRNEIKFRDTRGVYLSRSIGIYRLQATPSVGRSDGRS